MRKTADRRAAVADSCPGQQEYQSFIDSNGKKYFKRSGEKNELIRTIEEYVRTIEIKQRASRAD